MDDAKEYVEADGLMLYAVNVADSWWLAAADVAKTLKSATSADLPVEQVTKVDLAIALKTTQALGLTLPPSLPFRADAVLQCAWG